MRYTTELGRKAEPSRSATRIRAATGCENLVAHEVAMGVVDDGWLHPASSGGKLCRFVHPFMQKAQLRHLAARAEGRLPADAIRDVMEGVAGAGVKMASLLTPFLRQARNRWGVDAETAQRTFPGDELIEPPRWAWTHDIEIDAPASDVWPWIAQIGADRAGFYSYQWLEDVAGCHLRNAETIHPEWTVEEGGSLLLHPQMPPLRIVSVLPGRWFVAHAPADETARASDKPWATATWGFFVEPLGDRRCRFISRYRMACSDNIATRLQFGSTLIEPIGFAMDRRMLKGVKERAERELLGKARRTSITAEPQP
jgi:hypothetical protein